DLPVLPTLRRERGDTPLRRGQLPSVRAPRGHSPLELLRCPHGPETGAHHRKAVAGAGERLGSEPPPAGAEVCPAEREQGTGRIRSEAQPVEGRRCTVEGRDRIVRAAPREVERAAAALEGGPRPGAVDRRRIVLEPHYQRHAQLD